MIVLASSSATRQAMLRNAGLNFVALAPALDEKALAAANPHWLPRETALRLAEAKAINVSLRHADAQVIGADQVLALDNRVYGKPSNRAHCLAQLRALRGRTHALISAVVLARDGKAVWAHTDEALLTMRDYSDAFLEDYLEAIGDDCTKSVGGYKIEGRGVQLFRSVSGDHFTILGLPLVPLLQKLREAGEIAA
ncbi:Maf family nucleotide pyrophosphatase [Aestuariivirga sp.]|uniref:Maf family protein n=1 Tax=Aestuariivirga sp. TaxID=2650926 RepID=UPI0025BA3753|nr:Maf family nucleotide pyrophosphatase [Aestuariivirga sp.]MCA3554315.1 septum formation protein Maf [Aestuariivirga sp.]